MTKGSPKSLAILALGAEMFQWRNHLGHKLLFTSLGILAAFWAWHLDIRLKTEKWAEGRKEGREGRREEGGARKKT